MSDLLKQGFRKEGLAKTMFSQQTILFMFPVSILRFLRKPWEHFLWASLGACVRCVSKVVYSLTELRLWQPWA